MVSCISNHLIDFIYTTHNLILPFKHHFNITFIMKLHCSECDTSTSFDDEGYCNQCGNHADNVGATHIVTDELGNVFYSGSYEQCAEVVARPWNRGLTIHQV
jgi:hypothetical protein